MVLGPGSVVSVKSVMGFVSYVAMIPYLSVLPRLLSVVVLTNRGFGGLVKVKLDVPVDGAGNVLSSVYTPRRR
jgi:hypothetical protein